MVVYLDPAGSQFVSSVIHPVCRRSIYDKSQGSLYEAVRDFLDLVDLAVKLVYKPRTENTASPSGF